MTLIVNITHFVYCVYITMYNVPFQYIE